MRDAIGTFARKSPCRFHLGSVRAADDGIPKDASLHNRQGLSRPLPLREDEGGCGSEEDDAGRKVGADIRRECVFVPCPYGRAEGEKENQREIACNLKKNKVSLEIIALSTGLSIEEISTL